MKDCDLNDKEFKIVVMKILNKLLQNSERQFSEFTSKISEQKEYFTKKTETVRKNQTYSRAEELNK